MLKLKDRLKKVDIYFHVEEKLENKNLELEAVERELETKKSELEDIDKKIAEKKKKLASLQVEAVELKDFINYKFMEEFKEYDYKVDITNCYIVGLHGKKYIASRKHRTEVTDISTLAGGLYLIEHYNYYDVLRVKDNKTTFLHKYKFGHFSRCDIVPPKYDGDEPDYEEYILDAYPELSIYTDNMVPNTYLKKIYYEINDLGNKQLIKGHTN